MLLKDHTCLWDAVEDLRRFVREKLQVEVTHLHCDSDPMIRVNGKPSETYTWTRQKLSDAKIGCTFSPPHQHALNSYVENFRGRAIHVQNSMIQHAYLTSKLRGRAFLHAVQILNCLSVPGSDHPPLKEGNCPFSLFHGYDPDYSIFVAPWGSSCMVKSIGAKSSQLVPCSQYGILVNISSDCKSWEVYLPDKQKFVTTTHISVETDMSKRLALVEKFDLVLEQPGPMSTSAKAYAAGVRSLFSSSGLITPDLLIQLDPISRMPVKLVKFIDTNENTFLMPSDRIGDITDDGDSQTTADVGDLNPHMDDIGSAFIQYTALPANRSFPLPRPQLLTKAEKGMIKDAPDDVLLHWNDANPKIKNSFHRYAKYSKTKTLGEFRKNHRLVDLYNDLARGYVRF